MQNCVILLNLFAKTRNKTLISYNMKFRILIFIPLFIIGCITKDKKSTKNKVTEHDSYILYTVSKGENLSKISKDFNLDIEDIKLWNSLPNDVIRIGQKLNLYFHTDFVEKVKFGMTKSDFLKKLIIPPLVDSCRSYHGNFEKLESLRYNVEQSSMKLNNKNVCNLNLNFQSEISYVDFYFMEDSLSIIQFTRRGNHDYSKLIQQLTNSNFQMHKLDFESSFGEGIAFGDQVTVELSHATEMALTWQTYFRKRSKLLKYLSLHN